MHSLCDISGRPQCGDKDDEIKSKIMANFFFYGISREKILQPIETRRAYYHMQTCGDNVDWWEKYKKMYGAFKHTRGE